MLGNFYGVKAPASSSVSIPPIRSYQIPHHIFSVDLGVAPSHVLLVMIFPGKLLKSVYVHQPGCIFVPENPLWKLSGKIHRKTTTGRAGKTCFPQSNPVTQFFSDPIRYSQIFQFL